MFVLRVILLRLNCSLCVPFGLFSPPPTLLQSRNKKKTMQFKRPELPACHLAVTLNCLCSLCELFSFTRMHTHKLSCCSILKFHHERGRNTEESNFQNITLIKYSSSSGILLCSFSIRRSEVEKACYWSVSFGERHQTG